MKCSAFHRKMEVNVDSAIEDQTTSAREARDNKDQECKEMCANRFGGSAINTFGCYIDCKERNRDRSLEEVADARQVRSPQFEKCKENCIKDNGYTFLTAPCIHGCYYGGRSLELADFTRPVNPISAPEQPINPGQLLQNS
jgi:hypothetical protein